MTTTVYYSRLLFFAAGLTVCQSLVIIHPKYSDDLALLSHELAHVEQMRSCGTVVFWWRYLTSRDYRMAYEVEAYKVQVSHGASREHCAESLASKYFLGITTSTALAALA